MTGAWAALAAANHQELLGLPESALWSAVGLAVGYGAGRVHCWLAELEHRGDDEDTEAR